MLQGYLSLSTAPGGTDLRVCCDHHSPSYHSNPFNQSYCLAKDPPKKHQGLTLPHHPALPFEGAVTQAGDKQHCPQYYLTFLQHSLSIILHPSDIYGCHRTPTFSLPFDHPSRRNVPVSYIFLFLLPASICLAKPLVAIRLGKPYSWIPSGLSSDGLKFKLKIFGSLLSTACFQVFLI